jgi:hypothetical protein
VKQHGLLGCYVLKDVLKVSHCTLCTTYISAVSYLVEKSRCLILVDRNLEFSFRLWECRDPGSVSYPPSWSLHQLFDLIHLSDLAIVSWAVRVQKSIAYASIFKCFPLVNFKVSELALRSLIHFELTF